MYVVAKRQDKKLEEDLDEYISLIAMVQQEDGYISTKQIIADMQGGNSRLGDINDFEVYNFGHLFTAACVYKRITGKENFLDIAKKLRDIWKSSMKNILLGVWHRLRYALPITWGLWSFTGRLVKHVI